MKLTHHLSKLCYRLKSPKHKLVQLNWVMITLTYLGYTTLTAPDDGYVSNLKPYKGQLVSSGQALFSFFDKKNGG